MNEDKEETNTNNYPKEEIKEQNIIEETPEKSINEETKKTSISDLIKDYDKEKTIEDFIKEHEETKKDNNNTENK